MSDISIFKADIPAEYRAEGVSDLTKVLAGSNRVNRRITGKNGVFRKLVNGEEVGKMKGELNVIVVNALPSVSRQYYEKAYDPNGEPTLPDCWSNLGDKPEAGSVNPQAGSCQTCPQNVAGSGGGTRRACAFQRRIAVILEGDPLGEVYQMNLASTSIFGKGEGNTHPFDSYVRFLSANNKSIDRIVTTISFDEDADTTKFFFTPLRHLSTDEAMVAEQAGRSQEAKSVVRMTVAAQDGVRKLPAVAKAELEDEFAPPPTTAKAKLPQFDASDDPIEEPVKRASAKQSTPAPKANLADVVSAWSDE